MTRLEAMPLEARDAVRIVLEVDGLELAGDSSARDALALLADGDHTLEARLIALEVYVSRLLALRRRTPLRDTLPAHPAGQRLAE